MGQQHPAAAAEGDGDEAGSPAAGAAWPSGLPPGELSDLAAELTPAQRGTLQRAAQEVNRRAREAGELAERHGALLEELEAQNALLAERDELIVALRAREQADVTQWKERHLGALREMRAQYDTLAAELAAQREPDGAATGVRDAATTLSMRVDELERMVQHQQQQASAVTSPAPSPQTAAPVPHTPPSPAAAATCARELELEFGAGPESDRSEVRRARARAYAAERAQERAEEELAAWRSTAGDDATRREEQLEAAHRQCRDALSRMYQSRQEADRQSAALRSSELLLAEADLRRERAEEESRRLATELAAARRLEGCLRMELRRLTVEVRSPRCGGGPREADEASGRLRAACDALEPLLDSATPWEHSPQRAPSHSPDTTGSGGGTLLREVSRVEALRERLGSVLAAHDRERRRLDAALAQEEEARVREADELERALADTRHWLDVERRKSGALQRLLRAHSAEEESRRLLAADEQSAHGVEQARRALLADRLAALQERELRARHDAEDHETADRALLFAESDAAWQRLGAHYVPYMGLEVSGGITLRTPGGTRRVGGIAADGKCYVPLGVRVFAVAEGGPAEAAGIAPGDVITEVRDSEVQNIADFRAAARQARPGEEVRLQVWREGWGERLATLRTLPVDDSGFAPGARRRVNFTVQMHDGGIATRADAARREREERARRGAAALLEMRLRRQQLLQRTLAHASELTASPRRVSPPPRLGPGVRPVTDPPGHADGTANTHDTSGRFATPRLSPRPSARGLKSPYRRRDQLMQQSAQLSWRGLASARRRCRPSPRR
eukprot:TRINITY_DN55269_c0_g1_i1.p1 TRINITY_DN55269_c0_g1~~TRINITY_DN55269_c0_g1_i1.p1  ORF type:complete len:821 (+),score=195.43 TRINITY_DN55269_c0_g1_i1:67-2463(+)